MRARDLMIPLQDYLKPDDTVETAANLMKTARRSLTCTGVKGLPVLDENRKLLGIVSMGDVLKAVFPAYMAEADLGEFTWDGMVEGLARKARGKKVTEVMSKKVITVKEDAPLMECIDHMLKNRLKRMPVLDDNGQVVGMIYERDVFFAVTRAMMEEGR